LTTGKFLQQRESQENANSLERFDASGNIVEHYSDGDQVNCNTPFGREPAAPNTLYIWGPNIPLGFVTGRMEDAGKLVQEMQIGMEPDPIEAKIAQLDIRPAIVA